MESDHVVEEEPVQVNSYQELQDVNVLEKASIWQALMAKLREEEKEERERTGQLPVVPAAPRPKRKRKRAPTTSPGDVPLARKSARLAQRSGPAPSYHEEEEEKARGRSRTLGSGGARARSRQLRPRRPKTTYVEEELEPLDSVLFCDVCGVPREGGCALHPPVFSSGEEFSLKVEPSHIRKAGEGVINHGDVIPRGLLFGPYPGAFVPVEHRQQAEMSGNAWEITDPEGSGVLGFVDPGPAVDVTSGPLYWMVKVNCAPDSAGQNLEGFQFEKKIFYRVLKPIPAGKELLVFYGEPYANDLGVNVQLMDRYKGKEDHSSEGAPCGHCGTLFSTEEFLRQHLSTGGEGSTGCKASKSKKKAQAGSAERFSCAECSSSFSFKHDLARHISGVHDGTKFCCSRPGCGKSFTQKVSLVRHVATVHDGIKAFQCGTCGLSYGKKNNLDRHIASAHQLVRHSCHCGASFSEKSNLKRHQATVHGGKQRVQSKVKKYACTTCQEAGIDRRFRESAQLRRHLKAQHKEVYLREKEEYEAAHPYICKYAKCKKRFKTMKEKRRHQKKLHPLHR